jgi:hypothetical protein
LGSSGLLSRRVGMKGLGRWDLCNCKPRCALGSVVSATDREFAGRAPPRPTGARTAASLRPDQRPRLGQSTRCPPTTSTPAQPRDLGRVAARSESADGRRSPAAPRPEVRAAPVAANRRGGPTPTSASLQPSTTAEPQRGFELRGQLVEKTGYPVPLDVGDGDPVETGCAAVTAHIGPRPLQTSLPLPIMLA